VGFNQDSLPSKKIFGIPQNNMGPQVFTLAEKCNMKKCSKNSFAHGADVDHCAKIPLTGTKK